MKVFVDDRAGKNLCILEVDNSDTVLAIKEKITRCLRFHVSNQFLYLNDKLLLDYYVHASHLKIGPNSHLQLHVAPNRNHPLYKLHPTYQSPPPSNSSQQIIEWTEKIPSFSNNTQVLQTDQSPVSLSRVQDSPVMVRTNQEQRLNPDYFKDYFMVWRNKNESRWFSDNEVLRGSKDYFPSVIKTNQGFQLVESQEESDFFNVEIINIPDSPAKKKPSEESLGIQDYFPEASDYFKEINIPNLKPEITQQRSHVQDSPEQLWTREEYSDFVNEIINIPDSPAKKNIKTKMTVMVKPCEERRSIPVEVNESDDVKELRKELFRMQERGELNLPQGVFYLMHKFKILDEDVSFKKNRLTQGDTIEFFEEDFICNEDS